MAILQGLLAMAMRSFGKVLNTVFGWATLLLFGKVSAQRQYLLSAIAFGSALWLVVILGIAFPRLGVFLLAFVPLPEWVDARLVRAIMMGLAIVLPLLVGVAALFLNADQRPRTAGAKIKAVLKGYPYTLGLALAMVMMCVVAPVLKVRELARRWSSTHIAILVKSTDYAAVIADIRRVLREGGFDTVPVRAGWLIRWPTNVFVFFAGHTADQFVAQNLTVLQSRNLEVLLHPSDLVMRGPEHDVVRAHALITEKLTFTRAYQTWSKEANQIEERLAAVWRALQTNPAGTALDSEFGRLNALTATLQNLKVEYDEWEVLYRKKLVVDRAAWRLASRNHRSGKGTVRQAAASECAVTRGSSNWPVVAVLAGIALTGFVWRRVEGAGR
jgi:hypothetical protein